MNSLWKKDSKRHDACFVDLLKNAKSNKFVKLADKEIAAHLHSVYLTGNTKNDRIALIMKNTGNEKYRERRWSAAMDFYNQCLCHAEKGSELISIAYANRSACFYMLQMYTKCMIDIELALDADYPEHLVDKLEKRRINCHKALAKIERNSHPFWKPRLDYESHERFPEMANVLSVQYNEKYGRHIVAKDDIDVGRIVLIERPFSAGASVVAKIEQCITCFAVKQNFIACEGCDSAMFCGTMCRRKNRIHLLECSDQRPVKGATSRHVYTSVLNAITMFQNANAVIEFVSDSLRSEPKKYVYSTATEKMRYRSFLTLNITCKVDVEQKFIPVLYKAYTKLLSLKNVQRMFETKREKRFLLHLTAHHYLVYMSNLVNLWRIDKKALFIVQSYFNYACAPNILYYPYKGHTVCFSLRPIKRGEQLFVSYFGDFNDQMEVCHSIMMESIGFDCRCERCVPKFKENDLVPIFSDPCVKFLYKAFEDNEWKNPGKVPGLIDTCLKLMQMYGSDPWNCATEQIARWLLHCLYL